MSVEEDVELRDLVAQTLEANGCLAKIKAQLRASIFLALDEDVKISRKQPLLNNKVKTCLDTADGQIMFCIVREFLEFFNLHCTISVYEAESYLGTGYKYKGRQSILKELGIDDNSKVPILLQLMNIAQTKSKSIEINLNLNGSSVHEESHESEVETVSNIKTESNASKTSQLDNSSDKSQDGSVVNDNGSILPDKNESKNNTFNVSANNQSNEDNKTFELSSPSVALKNAQLSDICEVLTNKESNPSTKTSLKKLNSREDDTYEDTSSITEDSVTSNNKVPDTKLTNGDIENNDIISHPILKEAKLKESHEKVKLSPQKSEKLKSKGGLSSLTDLPPLQLNKNRVNDILPSLYNKEFKEKSNLRELDKLFDMETEYEEDFMCSGDLELTTRSDYIKSDQFKINAVENNEKLNKSTDNSLSSTSNKSNKNVKSIVNSNSNENVDQNTSRSISENLEYTSNATE